MKRARSSITSELTPKAVLVDLFDSDDFPVPIPDPEVAAEIVIRRLTDAALRSGPRPNHEAPAPIVPEAQPAKACDTRHKVAKVESNHGPPALLRRRVFRAIAPLLG
jgi:hypothetical protein